MNTYTFTSNGLKRLLGETIRLYQERRDEQDAVPATVQAVLGLLDAERELALGVEEQPEPSSAEVPPVAQVTIDPALF